MTKHLTVKIKRQNKFEFIANNKVCIEEEVPVNQSTVATEILSKRKNEQLPNSYAWVDYNNTFYEHFQLQVRGTNNPDDIEENNYDHVCDEARYY